MQREEGLEHNKERNMKDFDKYDEFLRGEAAWIWVVLTLMLIIIVASIAYYVPKAVRSKGEERRENIWIVSVIAVSLLPFIIYSAVTLTNVTRDVDNDLYTTYEGRFQIVEIYVTRSVDVKADVKFLTGGRRETYSLHPDAENKFKAGVYDGYVTYSENSDYIFDWGEHPAK